MHADVSQFWVSNTITFYVFAKNMQQKKMDIICRFCVKESFNIIYALRSLGGWFALWGPKELMKNKTTGLAVLVLYQKP